MIVRRRRNGHYTIVANRLAEDARLSFEAVGMMTYLLSRPDDWQVHTAQLCGRGGCGRDKARKIISELIEARYIVREQVRSEDGRRIEGVAYVVYDEPQEEDHAKAPTPALEAECQETENQGLDPLETAFQGPENQGPEKPSPYKEIIDNNTGLLKNPLPSPLPGGTSGKDLRKIEEAFWRTFTPWPSFAIASKKRALKRWFALPDEDRQRVTDAVPRYLAELEAAKRYPVSMANYLDQPDLWLPPPVTSTEASGPAPLAPWGPGWAEPVFCALLAGPVELGPSPITRQSRQQQYSHAVSLLGLDKAQATYRRMGHDFEPDGTLTFPDDFERRVWREHVLANGYPKLKKLYEAAREGRRLLPPDGFVGHPNLFEAVPVGLRTWHAWKVEFERRMWPWLPDPGKQPVVYFPAGGPDGLEAFAAAIRGKNNESGRPEAAE